MAEVRSGSFNTTGYSDPGYTDHYVFSWELVSQSIVNCTSTIKWSVKGAGGKSTEYWTYVQEKYVTVNGVTQTNTTKVATSYETVAFSGESVIKHSTSTGKGSFSASCGGAFYYYGSYNSTGKGSWDLPTIARATTPTVASSATMGSTVQISLAPADSSFKHKLTYAFGSLSGQTSGIASGTGFTGSGTVSVNFTPPTSLGSQIPNANSGTCTITCYTYNSGGTHIGTTTKTLTLNVPSYTPTCSVALSGVNLLSSTYVQSKSSVKVTITAATSYGASIKSYSTVIDGKTYTSQSFTTSVLSSGTKTATTTITDSRGKTVSANSASITVYAYAIPYVTTFTLTRQSTATTVVAAIKGGFSSINSKNAKTVKVTLNGVTNTVTLSAYTFDTTTTFTNVPTDSTFTGKLTLTDSYTNVTKDSVLPTVAVTMDFYKDGKGVAFGKVAETTDLLDVAWSERVRKNLTVDGTHTVTGNTTLGGTLNVDGVTTLNKVVTIIEADSAPLTIKRNHESSPATIKFQNSTGNLGYIGMNGPTANGGLKRWSADGATTYVVLDTENTKDYVMERGTSNGWEYTKWNNGKIELYADKSLSFPAGTLQATNLYRSIVSLDLKSLLTNVLSGTCAIQTNGMIPQVCRHGTTKTTAEIVIVTSRTFDAFTVTAPIYIIGKWK